MTKVDFVRGAGKAHMLLSLPVVFVGLSGGNVPAAVVGSAMYLSGVCLYGIAKLQVR
jgi:hypothetical protein